jgi:succinyl-CoA---D-citramalate CoA-transferase
MSTETSGTGPLSGLRVLELGQLIAGPFCGQLLGDLGAEVIKVEAPDKSDPMRGWGRDGYPLWWSVVARNKKCITLDLRSEEGQGIARHLASQCDFVLENFRPGTMEKWGLGYEDLKKVNQRIIMIRVSGYGQTGPYSSRAGYASVGEAMGGLRYVMGEPDRKPSRAGISLGDTLAGTFATIGALAALNHRDKTGDGQVVDASIFESVLAVMEAIVPEYEIEGVIRERSGSILPNVAPSNIYECSDGMVIVAANQDSVFARLCDAICLPALKSDPRFTDHSARGHNQSVLDDIIQAWTQTRRVEEVENIMTENAVPVGRIFTAPDMLSNDHYVAREAIVSPRSERWGKISMQNVFPKLSKTPGQVRWAGPDKRGQHTDQVLTDMLDIARSDLAGLRERGII